VFVFAPADWPGDELEPVEDKRRDNSVSLSRREIEVLGLEADGLGVPELAETLGLSPATVRTHFTSIYAKLDVRNRAGAVAKVPRFGLIN
jgi:DNA-binding CsgD family transcriptional regulator